MIESIKDMKRGKSNYENLNLERTASQILHHIEDKDSEESLESTRARVLANARTIYGPARHLDIVTFAPISARRIGAAIVEHNPTGRSYMHCSSAKEETRLGAMEHLLVITEDILQRLIDAEGIHSNGWLPNTAAAQQSAMSATLSGGTLGGSVAGSGSGSVSASRRSSVQPLEVSPSQHLHPSSDSLHGSNLERTHSDLIYQPQTLHQVPRTNSDTVHAPKPMPVGRVGVNHGRVQWNLGSEG